MLHSCAQPTGPWLWSTTRTSSRAARQGTRLSWRYREHTRQARCSTQHVVAAPAHGLQGAPSRRALKHCSEAQGPLRAQCKGRRASGSAWREVRAAQVLSNAHLREVHDRELQLASMRQHMTFQDELHVSEMDSCQRDGE